MWPQERAAWSDMTDGPEALAELTGVGRLLRHERIRRGMSQPALARLAGVTQSTVSRIESGVVFPSWSTVIALLAALDLQPQITAVPRWSDVDAVRRRLASLTLEERCADLEPWLAEIGDATADDAATRLALLAGVTAPVPMAVSGALAAQLLRYPVRPRHIELVAGAEPGTVRLVLAWTTGLMMQPLDPHTGTALRSTPEIVDALTWGHLLARWNGRRCLIRFDPDFASMPLTRVRLFDVDVPVLTEEVLTSDDPWTDRVLKEGRERCP